MPYTCDYPGCGRVFKTQAVLDSHKKTHPQIPPAGTSQSAESSVPSPAAQTLEDFLKQGIASKQDEKTLIFNALEKYPTETFSNIQLKIMTIQQAIKDAEVATKTIQVSVQSTPDIQKSQKSQPSLVVHKTKHAFTRFKDYNIMLLFGSQIEKYYTDVSPEILEEMREAAMNAIIKVIQSHPEINLLIDE